MGVETIPGLVLNLKESETEFAISPEKQIHKEDITAEKHTPKENLRKGIQYFGWDLHDTAIDTGGTSDEAFIYVSQKHFIQFGFDKDRALRILRKCPGWPADEKMTEVGGEYGFLANHPLVRNATKELRKLQSQMKGPALPHVDALMGKIREMGIEQFVMTDATVEDGWADLRYAELNKHFEPGTVIGSNTGGKKDLKKGPQQVKEAAKVFGVPDKEFTEHTAYITDMTRDIEALAPCRLRLLIGVSNRTHTIMDMLGMADHPSLTGDRYRVIRAVNDYNQIIGYINLVELYVSQNPNQAQK